MPTYCFQCYEDDGGCGETFEIQAPMSDATALKPKCPECSKLQPVRRSFQNESQTVLNSQHTLGSLADRNSNQRSTDEIASIHRKNTEYLDRPFTGKLPDGATPISKNSQGQRQASQKHRKVDPKRGKRERT